MPLKPNHFAEAQPSHSSARELVTLFAEAQRLELGRLLDQFEQLTQALHHPHAAVKLLGGERRQREQQMQRVLELESALEDHQRDLEQHAQLAQKRVELLERCAEPA